MILFTRDIKPANVMFLTKDKNSVLKLIDFGTAKTFQPKTQQMMTQIIGTLQYMSPE
jgi:serine/threonine protein kinase